jgi:hypothetical protein
LPQPTAERHRPVAIIDEQIQAGSALLPSPWSPPQDSMDRSTPCLTRTKNPRIGSGIVAMALHRSTDE